MKKRILNIIIIASSIVILNMPIVFITKRNYISQEQPDFPAKFDNFLDVSNENFLPKKQVLTMRENDLNGLSIILFNNIPFKKTNLKLRIYSLDNLEKSIINKTFQIHPDYFLSRTVLKLNKTIKASQNKEFLIVITPEKYSKEKLKILLANNENLLNIRPTYKTDNILKDIYYRTSQYKPMLLKNPSLLIIYIMFNISFFFLMKELLKKKRLE